MTRRRSGFTLFEAVAAMALTGLVMTIAVSFFIDVSRASERAIDHTRGSRRAISLLDRIARDLEGAFLITKAPDEDPLTHPWFFVAENRYASEGADQLLFVSTSQRPSARNHSSNIATVGYAVELSQDEVAGYQLLRRVTPGRPERYRSDYPRSRDDDSVVLATELASFSLSFLDRDGGEHSSWDSSQLADASQLPTAVEIRVAMLEDLPDEEELGFDTRDLREYRRRVVLPIRPLSWEILLEGGVLLATEENEECNYTVSQCLAEQIQNGADEPDAKSMEDWFTPNAARCWDWDAMNVAVTGIGWKQELCR